MSFQIAKHAVGQGKPCFIIAEIAQAHDGSLGNAHAYIDACADAGVDAVKFQTHIASEESTAREPWRIKFSHQDDSRYDYWKRMEFPPSAWEGLAKHAQERGLIFLSSPFSLKAVELLEKLNIPAWKVASGEIGNPRLLKRMAQTGKPVLLSSGLASLEELDRAVGWIKDAPFGVFQTTTAYPCPAERIGLNVLADFRERYNCPIGLSDHSAESASCIAAVALGANMLEVHVVFSHQCFGPDTSASLSVPQLKKMVADVRHVEKILNNPVDKNEEAVRASKLRSMFGKSVVASRPLAAGHQLSEVDLGLKKPGEGLLPIELDALIGRTLKKPIPKDGCVVWEDLESNE